MSHGPCEYYTAARIVDELFSLFAKRFCWTKVIFYKKNVSVSQSKEQTKKIVLSVVGQNEVLTKTSQSVLVPPQTTGSLDSDIGPEALALNDKPLDEASNGNREVEPPNSLDVENENVDSRVIHWRPWF